MAGKNNALQKPVTLSGDLENVIGKGPFFERLRGPVARFVLLALFYYPFRFNGFH